jgi:hypothetical protein
MNAKPATGADSAAAVDAFLELDAAGGTIKYNFTRATADFDVWVEGGKYADYKVAVD